MNESELIYQVVGLAMAVHRELGPDHAEIAYHRAMLATLSDGELTVSDRPTLTLERDGKTLVEYLPDCIVQQAGVTLILEFKAEPCVRETCLRQVRAYLAAYDGLATGLLLNFGGPSLAWRQVRASRKPSIPPNRA